MRQPRVAQEFAKKQSHPIYAYLHNYHKLYQKRRPNAKENTQFWALIAPKGFHPAKD